MEKYFYIAPSEIHGNGLFCSEDIKANIVMMPIAYIDGCGFLEISPIGKMVNHQKNGNTILVREGRSFFYLKAIRDIKAGEELTSDYTIAPPFFNRNIEGYKEL